MTFGKLNKLVHLCKDYFTETLNAVKKKSMMNNNRGIDMNNIFFQSQDNVFFSIHIANKNGSSRASMQDTDII